MNNADDWLNDLNDRNGKPLKGAAKEKRLAKIQRESLNFEETLTDLQQQVEQSRQQFEKSRLEVLQIISSESDEDLIFLVAAQEERIAKLESQLKTKTNLGFGVRRITKVLLQGSLAASICGTVVLMIHPTAAELGAAFGFVGGVSGCLISSIEEQEIRKKQ